MKNRHTSLIKKVDCCNPKSVIKRADSRHILLVGNPNCGKSTLFNRLCNLHVRTGNYPGVTVSRHVGNYKHGIQLIDVPGIYSLSSSTAEEAVATSELLDNDAELIVNIIDANSLERSLYLTLELKMLGVPMIVVLNMWDEACKSNIKIDIANLEKKLDLRVIPLSATSGYGVDILEHCIENTDWGIKEPIYIGSESIKNALNTLVDLTPNLYKSYAIFYAKCAIEGDAYPKEIASSEYLKKLEEVKQEISKDKSSIFEAISQDRYDFIKDTLDLCLDKKHIRPNVSSLLDKIILNKYFAFPIFIMIIGAVYYIAVSWLGSILTDWTNDVFFGELIIPEVSSYLSESGTSEWLVSLISDGVLGGVGTVLGFVPQMILLFTLLSLLEECGYMTRAAFILDKLFSLFGLSGRSFIPYLISSGCGVPGLMTARTLSSESERRITLFTSTMIPCGAKLPILIIFGQAFFGGSVIFAPLMYLCSIIMIVLSALILKKFNSFKQSASPLMLELPNYHIPSLKVVFLTVYHRSKAFIIKAGTVIFASVTCIWLLSSFGYNSDKGKIELVDSTDRSFLISIAEPITPIFNPIGIENYKGTVAIFTGLIAKENIVSTLALFSGISEDDSLAFEKALRTNIFNFEKNGTKAYLMAFSFVFFNLFTLPCFAAIGVLRREIGSKGLFWLSVLYIIGFSYGMSMSIYQLGMLFVYGCFGIETFISIMFLLVILYIIFIKKYPKLEESIQFKFIKD
ncbi:MAG: ferrous iron transport protein B [Succinivibrionaceae bacterium]